MKIERTLSKEAPRGNIYDCNGVLLAYNELAYSITISDNGCGISKNDLPRIREKFYKANNSARGSGIGLAVTDEIIKMHNGEMKIESTVGEGTTISITLPI